MFFLLFNSKYTMKLIKLVRLRVRSDDVLGKAVDFSFNIYSSRLSL